MPSFLVKFFLFFIKDSIRAKIKLNIFDNSPLKCALKLTDPILFIASKEDTMIDCYHTEKLYTNYCG